MASAPSFANVINLQLGQISTANTNLNGTGTIVDIFSPSANGSRVHRITIKAVGTTTAGMVRLFLHIGSDYRLLKEFIVPAITPSGTLPSFVAVLELHGEYAINLENGQVLAFSTHNAETFNIIVEGADL